MKQRTACENSFPFLFHTYCTHNRRRATATPLPCFVVVEWCKQHLEMLQEKPCKHPIQPMKKLKCKAFLHLFSPLPSPHQEKAQVFKTIYRSMYKGFFFFFFFFVKTWREKTDKMSTDVVHIGKNCGLSGSSVVPRRVMLMCEWVDKQRWSVRRPHWRRRRRREALTVNYRFPFPQGCCYQGFADFFCGFIF